ncbi:MAG: hypothetical protein HFF90_03595 [Oscillibacter sp.]|nr:hypothetical protein [Oscillibacter sp.]
MKHILLERLDSELSAVIDGLERAQALALAGLSISRLWSPFEKWAAENRAPKLAEWGRICVNTLWEQIVQEELYGRDFEKYYRCLDKIDGRLERLYDQEIAVEESPAYPLLEALNSALCCFFDPKLLPGLQRDSFWPDITAIAGQGAEYIYDVIFSDAGTISEHDLIALVESDPRWIAERRRIKEDAAFLKAHFKDKTAVLHQKEAYMQLDIFA